MERRLVCANCGQNSEDDTVRVTVATDSDIAMIVHCTDCGRSQFTPAEEAGRKGVPEAKEEFETRDGLLEYIAEETAFSASHVENDLDSASTGDE
jgi:hypothetical protein